MLLKKFFIVLFIFTCYFAFNNEKITNFKFKLYGPYDQRIYLLDNNKNANFGYYSIRPFISYKDKNYILNGFAIGTKSVQDKTTDKYQNKIDYQDLLNMNKTYYLFIRYTILMTVSGSTGLISIIPGLVFLGKTAYYNQFFNKTDGSVTENNIKYSIGEYYQLFVEGIYIPAGIALTIVGCSMIITSLVFLGIMVYHYLIFKDLKIFLLNELNKDYLSISNQKIKIKFNISFTFI